MKITQNKSYVLTFVIVALPILSIYKSPIQILDLGSFLLIISFTYAVLKNGKIFLNLPTEWKFYISYILLSLLIIYPLSLKNQNIAYVLLRSGKYILYLIISIYSACNGIFNLKLGLIYYKIIGILSLVLIYFQSFLYKIYDHVLIGVIPKLLFLQSYTDRFESNISSSRPTSFFLEPSHFFDYIMLLLIFALFCKRELHFRNYLFALFISIGLVLSTSGQAILYVIFAWGCILIKLLRKLTLKNILIVLTFLNSIPVLILLFWENAIIQRVFERIFNPNVIGGNAVIARSEGYIEFDKLPILNKLFGVGYANSPDFFFSSMSFNLYTLGIIGTLFILYIYYKSYKNSKENYIRFLIVSLIIVSFGNTTFMSVGAAFYFSFIYGSIFLNSNINMN